MKTTIDIPEKELADVIKFTRAKTKRMAIVAAVSDFNRRHKIASLTRYLGTCKNLMSLDELRRARQMG